MRVVSTSTRRSTNTSGLRLSRLSCSSGTPPSGANTDHSDVIEHSLRANWKKKPPEPVIGSRLRTLSLKPDHHKGMHSSLAIRPLVPAYMKLSLNRCVLASQNAAVSGSSSGRNLLWYTSVNTLKSERPQMAKNCSCVNTRMPASLSSSVCSCARFMSTAMIFLGPSHR